MGYFRAKNPNLGEFSLLNSPMEDDHLVYFTAVWYILLQFCIFNGYLVYVPPYVGMLYQENLATLVYIFGCLRNKGSGHNKKIN
jgi:hypothetical protein